MSQNKLGLIAAISLSVGNMVGSGILMLPGSLSQLGNSGLLGWITSGVGALVLAFIFSRLSFRFPQTGGPYVYVKKSLGDFMGFQTAWIYWFASIAMVLALATTFACYLSSYLPAVAESNTLALIVTLLSVWVMVLINITGIKFAGIVQTIITIIKLLPLLLICIIGFEYIDMDNITPITYGNSSGIFDSLTKSTTIALFAYIGLETATVPAGNIENPHKTISTATYIATIIATLFYFFCSFVIVGVMGADTLANSSAPFSDMVEKVINSDFSKYMGLIGAFICLASINGWTLVQGQIPYAASKDGYMPKYLSQKINDVPVAGIITSATIVSLALIMMFEFDLRCQFEYVINITAFLSLIPYMYCAISEIVMTKKQNINAHQKETMTSIMVQTVAVIGFAYSLWAIAGTSRKLVYFGIIITLSITPLYAFFHKRNEPKNE